MANEVAALGVSFTAEGPRRRDVIFARNGILNTRLVISRLNNIARMYIYDVYADVISNIDM